MDAIDALLCFGYSLIKNSQSSQKNKYVLCSDNADWKHHHKSINLLLKEIDESKDYYTSIINDKYKGKS